jgi:hypothetical protein
MLKPVPPGDNAASNIYEILDAPIKMSRTIGLLENFYLCHWKLIDYKTFFIQKYVLLPYENT